MAQLRNGRRTVLQEGGAQGRIGVDRAAQQRLQLAIGFGAEIDPAEPGLGGLIFGAIERRADGQRQHRALAHAGPEVAQRIGANQRQEDIRPRPHPVAAERVAKAVVMMRQVEIGRLGDIKQSANPDGRVDAKTRQRLECALRLQLQHIVGENERLADIGKNVADAGAHHLGHDFLIRHRHRTQENPVEKLMDREHHPVEAFERIALGMVAVHPGGLPGHAGGERRSDRSRLHARRRRSRRRLLRRHGGGEQRDCHRQHAARRSNRHST
ncbi:hypothetical protein D9M73_127280 [compost metagenome]